MTSYKEKQLIRHTESVSEWLGVDFAEALSIVHEEHNIGFEGMLEKYAGRAKGPKPQAIPYLHGNYLNDSGEDDWAR